MSHASYRTDYLLSQSCSCQHGQTDFHLFNRAKVMAMLVLVSHKMKWSFTIFTTNWDYNDLLNHFIKNDLPLVVNYHSYFSWNKVPLGIPGGAGLCLSIVVPCHFLHRQTSWKTGGLGSQPLCTISYIQLADQSCQQNELSVMMSCTCVSQGNPVKWCINSIEQTKWCNASFWSYRQKLINFTITMLSIKL